MNLLPLLFALAPLAPDNATVKPATPVVVPAPGQMQSFMVSEDYAEIDWNAVQNASAYQIQIRKADNPAATVLADKTVWTSFYFRVAEPAASYEFRLAAVSGGQQSAWTSWTPLNTVNSDNSITLAEKN